MKNRCLFCGKELTMMQKKKLHCGNTIQTLCGDCYGRYKSLPAVERAEAALNTGRAEDAAALKEYLKPIQEARLREEETQRNKHKSRLSGKKCLRCEGELLHYGPITFKLGEETYFFSDINRLISGSLTMEVLRCASCGKAEFYIPDEKELDRMIETH